MNFNNNNNNITNNNINNNNISNNTNLLNKLSLQLQEKPIFKKTTFMNDMQQENF